MKSLDQIETCSIYKILSNTIISLMLMIKKRKGNSKVGKNLDWLGWLTPQDL